MTVLSSPTTTTGLVTANQPADDKLVVVSSTKPAAALGQESTAWLFPSAISKGTPSSGTIGIPALKK